MELCYRRYTVAKKAMLAGNYVLSSRVQRLLGNWFESWALIVARRPWVVLIVSTLIACASTAGIISISVTGESSILWTIRERGYDSMQYMADTFGGSTTRMMIYCEPVRSSSIFSTDAMSEMRRLHNWTINELRTTASDGTTIGFSDVCAKSDGVTCDAYHTHVTLTGAFASASAELGISPWNVAGVRSVGTMASGFAILEVASPTALDSNGAIASAPSVMLHFDLHEDESNHDVDFQNAWNEQVEHACSLPVLSPHPFPLPMMPHGMLTSLPVMSQVMTDFLRFGTWQVATIADPTLLRATHWSAAGLNKE